VVHLYKDYKNITKNREIYMSQLIALIIAIALGAIVTAIGYVFLGDVFTSGSAKGLAQTFISQASQLEMAMTAFRAENAGSAFVTSFALTMSNDGAGSTGSTNGLIPEEYLKSIMAAPLELTYTLVEASGDVFLVSQGTDLTQDVCRHISGLAINRGQVDVATMTSADVEFNAIATGAEVNGALGNLRFGCFQDTTTTTEHVFAYSVE
jgi:ABC-type multidrug transport system fused ATPase/permease subunit